MKKIELNSNLKNLLFFLFVRGNNNLDQFLSSKKSYESLFRFCYLEFKIYIVLRWPLLENLHDGDVVSCRELLVVHLGDEDGGDGDEERGAVHVDRGADGQDELGDAAVHLGFVHAAEGDGQGGGAGDG